MLQILSDITKLLTYQDVAQKLHMHEGSVRRLVSTRRISYVKIGGRVRFKPEHIEAFIKEIPAQK